MHEQGSAGRCASTSDDPITRGYWCMRPDWSRSAPLVRPLGVYGTIGRWNQFRDRLDSREREIGKLTVVLSVGSQADARSPCDDIRRECAPFAGLLASKAQWDAGSSLMFVFKLVHMCESPGYGVGKLGRHEACRSQEGWTMRHCGQLKIPGLRCKRHSIE